jgi:nicotinate-nucleotide adenylyltransferase
MLKVGIYGGAFDPIHNGHLITAQAVKEMRELDKIIFVPTYISPHKQDVEISGVEHRVNMLQIAINRIPYFEYSDVELKRKMVSYAVDTIRELSERYKHIELIIGYDNIFKFHTWRQPDEIIRMAKLVVLRRKLNIPRGQQNKFYRAAAFVKSPFIQISGSVIRRRVQDNLPINFLVPEKVQEYILKNKLYKGPLP